MPLQGKAKQGKCICIAREGRQVPLQFKAWQGTEVCKACALANKARQGKGRRGKARQVTFQGKANAFAD